MKASVKEYRPGLHTQNEFWATVGIPSRGAKQHKIIHSGFPYTVFSKLAHMSGLDNWELTKVIGIAPATLRRRAKLGRFNQNESDRLYRFAEVLKAAIDLFEGILILQDFG